jgi:Tol biopolymer transport system component
MGLALRRALACLPAIGLLAACASPVGTASQPNSCPSPDTGQKASAATATIAFTKGTQIYLVQADGTGLRGLTGVSVYDNQPAWSHDGTRIAFSRSRSDVPDSKPQIFVMGPDGSGVRRLTCDNRYEDSPAWSPDGTRIAYSRHELDDRDSIVTMGADGSNPVAVARYDSFDDASVAWSPDGQHIAYTTKTGIVVMKPDGTGAHQLTSSTADSTVSWSPNSKWIAFTRGAANSSLSQIWVIPATGGTPRRITTSGSYGSPSWSPDGLKLAFASQPGKPSRLYVSNADGTQLHAITQPLDDVVNWVAWSPAI